MKRKKAFKDVMKVCNDLLEYLTINIRYKEWPTKELGIGLQVEELDELLINSEYTLKKAKKSWKSRS